MDSGPTEHIKAAEAVRRACLAAARDAYEDAGLSGLCAEGRWEAALSAVARLDLARVLEDADAAGPESADGASGGDGAEQND